MRETDLVGGSEAAAILGVELEMVMQWCRPGTGRRGPRGTYMPEPAGVSVDGADLWLYGELAELAAERAARGDDLVRRAAEVRREMYSEPADQAQAWIVWNDVAIGHLFAANGDGDGPWRVGPVGPADGSNVADGVKVGDTLSVAILRGLDVVSKLIARDLINGIDPRGPGGYAGPSLLEPLRPEAAEHDPNENWRTT